MAIKCYLDEKEIINTEDTVISISNKDHFIKSILCKKTYDLVIELVDKKYQKEELFTLKVDVNKVGVFYFYIELASINKDMFEEIKKLKELKVNDDESASNKVNKLFSIINQHGFLFVIYYSYKNGFDVKDPLKGLVDKHLFIINEPLLSDEDIDHSFLALLKSYKLRWLLLLIGGIVMVISGLYGSFNALLDNMGLFIFMIIVSLAGVIALFIGHKDYFDKKPDIYSKESLLVVIVDILATACGCFGAFGLYKLLPENTISFTKVSLIGIGGALLIYTLVILITYFISNRKAKK